MTSRFVLNCSVLICVTLLTSCISASVLKEALEEHLKDVEHKDEEETVQVDKHKGEKIHQIESNVKDDHKNQYSKANDEGKYLNKEHDSNSASESDVYQGYNAKQDKAEDSATTGFKRGHKKGHRNQGFQNSYHKDESSNKSTFFDDFNDEGDQAAYNMRLNNHNNQGDRSYQGSQSKGKEHIRDDYTGGGYNRHGDNGLKHNAHYDYGKKYYLDDNLRHNKHHNDRDLRNRDRSYNRQEHHHPPVRQDPGWDWKGLDDRRGWDDRSGWDDREGWDDGRGFRRPASPDWQRDPGWNDYNGPGYYDDRGIRHEGGYGYGPQHGYGYGESRADPVAAVPKNAPIVAHRKQTITIYEDPRYDGKDKGNLRREEGDYLQLDFKPSSQRYASYDDTYYSSPREKSTETSKINRLVYNYRRQ